MAVPVSYTYDEFADYLKNEVLGDSADGLGFGDTVPEIPEISARITIREGDTVTFGTPPYNDTDDIPIYQPGFSVPIGTSLTWSNGATRTLATALTDTDVKMDINGLGANFNPGDYAEITIRNAVARIRNPIYVSITDEVLYHMGLAIEEVDSSNIELFRAYGRVELLRKVVQNIGGNYSYAMPVGGQSNQTAVYTQVKKMYEREQDRLAGLLREAASIIPNEASSESMDVTLVW